MIGLPKLLLTAALLLAPAFALGAVAGKSIQGVFSVLVELCGTSGCEKRTLNQPFRIYVGQSNGVYVYHDGSGGRLLEYGKTLKYFHNGVNYAANATAAGNTIRFNLVNLDDRGVKVVIAVAVSGANCRISVDASDLRRSSTLPAGAKFSIRATSGKCTVRNGNIF